MESVKDSAGSSAQDRLTRDRVLNQSNMQLFDLRWFFDTVLDYWKWFVLSVVVCLGAMVYHLASTPSVYQRNSVMLVKDEQQRGPKILSNILNNGGPMGPAASSGIENELFILCSNQLMRYVVEDLKLDIEYSQKRGLQQIALYGNLPFEVQFDNAFSGYVAFDVKEVHKNGVLLNRFVAEGEELLKEQFVSYDSLTVTPVGNVRILAKGTPIDRVLEDPILVSRVNKKAAAGALRGKVSTAEVSKNSTLVNISCRDVNPARAEAVLNSLMEGYRRTLIEDKNKVASNTAEFIEARIQIIGKELGAVEEELTQLKEDHGMIDISTAVTSSLAEGAKAKDKGIELGTQLSVAKFVREFVTDASKRNALIPNVSGIKDAGVEAQIQAYNELLLRHNRLLENSGENNSVVQELNRNLMAMRGTIQGSLDTYCETISLLIDEAHKQEARSRAGIKAIPMQEKKVLDVTRQQAIKERLYSFLLQNREEIAMQLAGTEANVRVVEEPYGSMAPVAPARKHLLLYALLAGLAAPYLFIFIRSFLDRGVRGTKDIEDFTSISVIGEIPRGKVKADDLGTIVMNERRDKASEAFRLMRTNLAFFNKEAKVLMFTSTTAHEGKSFISRNFAVTLALGGKRVLLVDTDIRKGTLSKRLKVYRKEGLSTYLSGQSEDFGQLIVADVLTKGVDFLPSGMVPPNPSELLMRDRLDEMFAALRDQYDYILVDNVPAMVVADATIVNRVADATLYVVRDGVMDRRYLPKLERMYREKKFKNLSIVLNDVKYAAHSYGYGYGQGYGYYAEDSDDKGLWNRFKRLFK